MRSMKLFVPFQGVGSEVVCVRSFAASKAHVFELAPTHVFPFIDGRAEHSHLTRTDTPDRWQVRGQRSPYVACSDTAGYTSTPHGAF